MAEVTAATETAATAQTAAVSDVPATDTVLTAEQSAVEAQTAQAIPASPDLLNDDAPAADPEKPAEDPAKPIEGAPEKYEFKAPEGAALDATVIADFADVARELNLPQDAAQKIIDKIAPKLAAQQTAALETLSNQWVDQVKSDKDIGGDKLQTSLATAKKALDAYGSPELRQLLGTSKLGNNPDVIRFFYNVGKTLSEDSVVTGKQGKGDGHNGATAAATLYPTK
jgi:hypothetical protein